MNHRVIRHLMRSPSALNRVCLTGRLPKERKIESPLITLLESLPNGLLSEIRGITLAPNLGYDSGATFSNGWELLRWLKPRSHLVGNETTPAESRKIKSFNRKVSLSDLKKQSSKWPSDEMLNHLNLL